MNIQQTVSLYDNKCSRTLTLQYKFENIQSSSYYKSLQDLVNYGKNCHLKDNLENLITLINDNINIGEKLEEKSYSHNKAILNKKKIFNKKIINCMSYSTLDKFTKILANAFTSDADFYDFSLGLLDIAKDKIKKDVLKDYNIIKRVVNPDWWFEIITEGTNILHYGNLFKNYSKHHIIQMNDSYANEFSELISSSFIQSIEPYSDILMEKITGNIFRSLCNNIESPFGLYDKMEELAWKIYGQELDYRYINNFKNDEFKKIQEDFKNLCDLYTKEFTEHTMYSSSPLNLKREQTIAVFADEILTPKIINFKDFKSYNNSYMKKYYEIIDKGLDIPLNKNLEEIKNNINRTKRYLDITIYCKKTFSEFLNNCETDNFETIIKKFEKFLTNAQEYICELYSIDF